MPNDNIDKTYFDGLLAGTRATVDTIAEGILPQLRSLRESDMINANSARCTISNLCLIMQITIALAERNISNQIREFPTEKVSISLTFSDRMLGFNTCQAISSVFTQLNRKSEIIPEMSSDQLFAPVDNLDFEIGLMHSLMRHFEIRCKYDRSAGDLIGQQLKAIFALAKFSKAALRYLVGNLERFNPSHYPVEDSAEIQAAYESLQGIISRIQRP